MQQDGEVKTPPHSVDARGALVIDIPDGGFPDDQYMTLDEAAEIWGVTRANIKYYTTQKGVPSKKKKIPIPVQKNVIHVHMPSLKLAKDLRVHDGGGHGKNPTPDEWQNKGAQ